MHPRTKNIWFRDLLPDYLADDQLGTNARIWTFGYNASFVSSAKSSIFDYSTQLLNRVNSVRDGYEHHKIIWVCYSFGGLVVKSVRFSASGLLLILMVIQALIEAHINQQYRSILSSTVGIVFMGTPHQGTNLASMAAIYARIIEKTLVFRPPTELLRSLIRDSDTLDQSWRLFRNICQHIQICSFYETLTTGRNKASSSRVKPSLVT